MKTQFILLAICFGMLAGCSGSNPPPAGQGANFNPNPGASPTPTPAPTPTEHSVILNLEDATWTASIPPGDFYPVTFGDLADPTRGTAIIAPDTALSGGGTLAGFRVHPPYFPSSAIVARLTGIDLPDEPNLYFEWAYGLAVEPECGNGVDMVVTVDDGTNVMSAPLVLVRMAGRQTLLADLSAFSPRGPVNVEIRTNAGVDSTCDHVVMSQPQFHGVHENAVVLDGSLATWSTSLGETLVWNAEPPYDPGSVIAVENVIPSGGAPAFISGFRMHPPYMPDATISGLFPEMMIAADATQVTFVANIGFASLPECGEGSRFEVYIADGISPLPTLAAHEMQRFQRKFTMTADLNAYRGQTVRLMLQVNALTDSHCDHAIWENARVVTQR